jgi:hypothetical protein
MVLQSPKLQGLTESALFLTQTDCTMFPDKLHDVFGPGTDRLHDVRPELQTNYTMFFRARETKTFSLIEGEPVRGVFPGDGEDLLHAAVILPVPGVIPAVAHIAVKGRTYPEFLQTGLEVGISHRRGAVHDAELPADVTQGAVTVHGLRLEASHELLPVEENKILTEAATAPGGSCHIDFSD